MNKNFIIIHGNPVDGFFYIGPFDDLDDTITWAEEYFGDYWIAPLENPDD